MHYLITGGCGYIGGHTAIKLHEEGHSVTLFDNFSSSTQASLEALQDLCDEKLRFIHVDLKDIDSLRSGFSQSERFDGVIHAASTSPSNSNSSNIDYVYENNVKATQNLCDVMFEYRVFNLVFASSASVYGRPTKLPLSELCRMDPQSPFGHAKRLAESELARRSIEHPEWRISSLRYFNVGGSHPCATIGSKLSSSDTSIFSELTKVICGDTSFFPIFGDSFHTHDGTSVQDYVHVLDVASANISALEYNDKNKGFEVFNVGTGIGYSVIDILQKSQEVSGLVIPSVLKEKRDNEFSEVISDQRKSITLLKWQPKYSIDALLKDHWRHTFQSEVSNAP
ncbi:UDP-glucose 4-epimerase GalE (plasmid) [Alteromonas mediterranea]|uniref:UDP-glucose 4-epimerase n=1 Tax=Alteromonas mediterranea TaxID=314275 RepID=A0AAC9NTM4_9ALTE|nr:UDP-glucose 4-epimerase GalE [Alteromonas mediterranea]APD92388.1 UDP-glucose 4-epimerase GalE [Alteromonas mediterranea]APE00249.1 UDP-glucose 4-epimerase GalE [Alteromonas mediterranea]